MARSLFKPSQPVPDEWLILLIHQIANLEHDISVQLDAALAGLNLTATRWWALRELVLSDKPLNLQRLASRLHYSRANITLTVDRLVADQMVERIDDPMDNRRVLASITQLGRAKHDEGLQTVMAVQADILRRSTRPEVVRLYKQLTMAIEMLEETGAFREEV